MSVLASSPPLSWNLNGLQFDAWLELNHNTSITITEHPVETGAAITDHSYWNPRKFSFRIGETDVATLPSIAGSSTRSVNAYQALVSMQFSRQLLSLTTKYGTFTNVLIESIDVPDNFQTKFALKATINLQEVIIVSTQLIKASAAPQITNLTNRGQVSAQSVTGLVRTAANAILGGIGISL